MPDTPWLDIAWMLTCTALVLFMQAGFCCLETGLVRAKNSINVAIKNLIDFCAAGILYWCFGFALMYGVSFAGLMGTSGFFFQPQTPQSSAFFIFQMVFCGTATTIVAGAVAERMRFAGYLICACLLSGLIYPLFGHWAWNGLPEGNPAGFLARLGFIDFAGSTVVHAVGGWFALAAVLTIGPRKGRFDQHTTPIYGHNIPLATLGVFILWLGWFGFNGGSTLAFSGQVPTVLFNTALAGMFGGAAALVASWLMHTCPRVEAVINGVLAGLVGITASCHIVSGSDAAIIGLIAGVLSVGAGRVLEQMHIDDAVGAIPVHAVAGLWGTLAVALFGTPEAWGTGLDRWNQFQVQLIGAGLCFGVVFGGGWVCLQIINRFVPLRATPEAEDIGLNVMEHNARTDAHDLLSDMETHWQKGDFSRTVRVEPHTEVGKIADQYNRVLNRVVTEQRRVHREADRARRAQEETARANAELQETICDLNTFNEMAVDREIRLVDLKSEINRLNHKLGNPKPYDLSAFDNPNTKDRV